MGDRTKIEWADATWNPVTGCTEVSAGCDNCYAKTFSERFRGTPGHYLENGFDVTLRPGLLDKPLRWRRPRRVFVNSLSDLFHKEIPDEYIARVFAIMACTPRHTYQILTKRPARMASWLNDYAAGGRHVWEAAQQIEMPKGQDKPAVSGWPLPNIWLGVSVEDQKTADLRIPKLLDTPAAVRFLSAEPLLGPVDVTQWLHDSTCPYAEPLPVDLFCNCTEPREDRVDWLIIGGESGRGARPMELSWARSLVNQCKDAGAAPFVKQLGSAWAREHTKRALDCGPADPKGGDWSHWAPVYRVREMPSDV